MMRKRYPCAWCDKTHPITIRLRDDEVVVKITDLREILNDYCSSAKRGYLFRLAKALKESAYEDQEDE